MQFSPPSCHFIPLQSKYFLQQPLLKHPQSVPPLMPETTFHNHTEQRANYDRTSGILECLYQSIRIWSI
jgi:hypothetical protein